MTVFSEAQVHSQLVVPPHYQKQQSISRRLRREAKREESKTELLRRNWRILPPDNMSIILHQDVGAIPGGMVLSVPHEVGRMLLHKRLGRILEHDVTIDAVLDGEIEDVVDAIEATAA